MRIVPAPEELEHAHASVDLRVGAVPIEPLPLQHREVALAHLVVAGIAHRAHRGPHARISATTPGLDRGVPASLRHEHQLHHPAADPRRVLGSVLRHRRTSLDPKGSEVHETGSAPQTFSMARRWIGKLVFGAPPAPSSLEL